jgi:AcrR family transcriptional regulator
MLGVMSAKTTVGESPREAQPGRNDRRKARTRSSLLRAARALFAKRGFEQTAIADITDAADVGVGSFYNHFDSKEDLLAALLEQAFSEQLAALDSRRGGVSDPAEAVAIAHRHWVRLTTEGPEWAWLVVRLETSFELVTATQGDSARKDLERGIACGRFQVASRELALQASGGALIAAMRTVLTGAEIAEADSIHAEGVLRMFGVSAQEAGEVARRPLPDVTHDKGEQGQG